MGRRVIWYSAVIETGPRKLGSVWVVDLKNLPRVYFDLVRMSEVGTNRVWAVDCVDYLRLRDANDDRDVMLTL